MLYLKEYSNKRKFNFLFLCYTNSGDVMKILASDFDETIYFPDNKEVNGKNIESIKNFISNGNIFCIITGRNYTDLKQ